MECRWNVWPIPKATFTCDLEVLSSALPSSGRVLLMKSERKKRNQPNSRPDSFGGCEINAVSGVLLSLEILLILSLSFYCPEKKSASDV